MGQQPEGPGDASPKGGAKATGARGGLQGGHYRRNKTTKAPRKRTFIAHMTKYSSEELALESASRGVGAGQARGGSANRIVDPHLLAFNGPPDASTASAASWSTSAAGVASAPHVLDAGLGTLLSAHASLPAPAVGNLLGYMHSLDPARAASMPLGVPQQLQPNSLPAELAALPTFAPPVTLGAKHAPAHTASMTGAGSMTVDTLSAASAATSLSGMSFSHAAPSLHSNKVSFDMFPELAALASPNAGASFGDFLLPQPSYGRASCASRSVVTSVDTFALPVAAAARAGMGLSAGQAHFGSAASLPQAASLSTEMAALTVPSSPRPAAAAAQPAADSVSARGAGRAPASQQPAPQSRSPVLTPAAAPGAAASAGHVSLDSVPSNTPADVTGIAAAAAAATVTSGNLSSLLAGTTSFLPPASAATTTVGTTASAPVAPSGPKKRGRRPRNAAAAATASATGNNTAAAPCTAANGAAPGADTNVHIIPLHGVSAAGAVVPGSAGNVRLSRMVSVGAYGLVFRGQWAGRDVAVKLMRSPGPSEQLSARDILESFRREASLLQRLTHPNIVALRHAQDVAPVCLVQDFAAHGTLAGYIHAAPSTAGPSAGVAGVGSTAAFTELESRVLTRLARRLAQPADSLLSELELRSLASGAARTGGAARGCLRRYIVLLCLLRDMASGLAYLAAPPPSTQLPAVVHRDVKPSNVLLTGQGTAQLADFGVSHVLTPRDASAVPLDALSAAARAAAAADAAHAAVAAAAAAAVAAVNAAPPAPAPGPTDAASLTGVYLSWQEGAGAAAAPRTAPPAAPAAAPVVVAAQPRAAAAEGAEERIPKRPRMFPSLLPPDVDILPSVDMDLTWLEGLLDEGDMADQAWGLMGGNPAATQAGGVTSSTSSGGLCGASPAVSELGGAATPSASSSSGSSVSVTACQPAGADSAHHPGNGWPVGPLQSAASTPAPLAAVTAPAPAHAAAGATSVPAALVGAPAPLVRHGTAHYAAPEDLAPGVYAVTPAADVYSWACCAWEALSGARPWAATSSAGVEVVVGRQGARLPVPGAWPARMRGLLSACWATDPAARPPAGQLVLEIDAEIRTALSA